jgi:hypothetical protein
MHQTHTTTCIASFKHNSWQFLTYNQLELAWGTKISLKLN